MMKTLALGLNTIAALALTALAAGCSDDGGGTGGNAGAAGTSATAGTAGVGGSAAGSGGSGTMAGSGGSGGSVAGSTAGGSAGAGGTGGGGGSGGMSSSKCAVSATDDAQPMMLSETGCVDMSDPAKPAAGLIPYSVRSPLWSDGAKKERFMRIPDGAKIHVLDCAVETDKCKPPGLGGVGSDDGHWDMPVGTVLVKNFSIENKRIETRLFMRRSMMVWKGFSYEWNDAGTDATLLPDDNTGKDKPVGTGNQVWHYPSRPQCLECHSTYSGRSLGPTTAQLNSDFAYADGMMNQVEKFKQLGLFDAAPKDIAGLPDPAGNGTTEEKALSYLQTNCSICHRPGSEGGLLDLRFGTAFADRGLCSAAERDAGLVPKYRLVPQDTAKSGLSVRMHALDMIRMPKIGSKVLDPTGTQVVDDWIKALPADACPGQTP
ncbi:MAG TPA: hypothetical protein VHB79_09950 [Polyangiaceae bacterium]|nr:hypothetical protein [Polyangiaceae bacterium]